MAVEATENETEFIMKWHHFKLDSCTVKFIAIRHKLYLTRHAKQGMWTQTIPYHIIGHNSAVDQNI